MIGWLVDAIRAQVLDPQCDERTPEPLRARVRVGEQFLGPIDLVFTNTTTSPVAGANLIGGGGQLRHVVDVSVISAHGDLEVAKARRDGVVMDLVQRVMPGTGDPSLGGAHTTAGEQELQHVDWSVQYADVSGGTQLVAFAVLTLTAVVDWYPARLRP